LIRSNANSPLPIARPNPSNTSLHIARPNPTQYLSFFLPPSFLCFARSYRALSMSVVVEYRISGAIGVVKYPIVKYPISGAIVPNLGCCTQSILSIFMLLDKFKCAILLCPYTSLNLQYSRRPIETSAHKTPTQLGTTHQLYPPIPPQPQLQSHLSFGTSSAQYSIGSYVNPTHPFHPNRSCNPTCHLELLLLNMDSIGSYVNPTERISDLFEYRTLVESCSCYHSVASIHTLSVYGILTLCSYPSQISLHL
jgi:hypothetical protein